jgi:DNA-binding winged helix-turn-helix (wHTH) protein/tetratricopeptide (TPR) repeat protein
LDPKKPHTSPLPDFSVAGSGLRSDEPGYCFGGFRLEADGTLFREEAVVHLPPKELAALRCLLANAGQIVPPLQLRKKLWGEVHVTADSVPKCISSLRARLEPEEFIQTVYKRGYRLTGEVRRFGVAPAEVLPRLAILPFDTNYAVPEYLGAAIAEETIARLSNARHPRICVLARDSVFTLAQNGLTAQQLGETLKADLVLTGTLRALPASYRLRTEMIRVKDGAQIWVEDILVPKIRIAGLESELVGRLLFRLGAEVPGDGSRQLGRNAGGFSISAAAEQENSPQHREAYEIFQRARYEWQTLQRHRMQDGLQHLSHAAELDPTLISAKIDLVHLCVTQAFYGFMSPSVAADLVRRTAESIPDFPHGSEAVLPALGWVHFHADHNLPAAIWAFSLTSHLPHDPWVTRVRAMFELSRHHFAAAITLLRKALQEDPYSPWLHNRLAWALHLDGRATESVEHVRRGISLFPGHEGTSLYGSVILAYNGHTERATELAQKLTQHLPYFDLATAVHAYALACSGRTDEAHAILERLQWMSRERFVIRSFTPAVYVALGDHDAALAELRTASEDRCPWFFQMLADPRLKPLHGHPEFARMGEILSSMEAAAAQDPEFEYGAFA